MTRQGRIIRATGGFYYVFTPDGDEIECRARGVFRKDGRTPLVGDEVVIQINEDKSGTVAEIEPRRNRLIRPPLANLDFMVVVTSLSDPAPSLLVLDTYLALLESCEIEPVVAFTKADLADPGPLRELYTRAGYDVHVLHTPSGEGVAEIAEILRGKTCAFAGNSGAGKSTLLNAMDPQLHIPVGETSKKLGRGKHTTRHVELYPLQGGGWVADTPGFSSLDAATVLEIDKSGLAGCFREFEPYVGRCRFRDCAHLAEQGCAVVAAVERGEIAASRHQSYRQLYESLREVRQWEQKSR